MAMRCLFSEEAIQSYERKIVMGNERGGIIFKLFMLPIIVALMAGFFFLGYYVGKYQSKTGALNEILPPLPDIVSKNLPAKEEFTFYKTLTDKNDKTVSINLKPAPSHDETKTEKKQPVAEPPAKQQNQAANKPPQVQAKKEAAQPSSSSVRIKYTVQLASYQEKELADADVKKLKQRGYAAFIVSADVPGKGTWHRVRIGSFSNKAAAEKLQKEIKAKEGFTVIVVME